MNKWPHQVSQILKLDGTCGQATINAQNTFDSIKLFPFIKRESMLIPVTGNQSINYFRHVLTDKFIDHIVSEINEYAMEIFCTLK